MDGILEKIGQLAVFLICAQTLVHFRAAQSYEKYIKLLVSLIMLVLILNPLGTLLGMGKNDDLMDHIRTYEQRLREIASNPMMQKEDINTMINSITEKKLLEGLEYMEQETEGKEEAEEINAVSDAISVEVDTIFIEKIELGGSDGKSTENP